MLKMPRRGRKGNPGSQSTQDPQVLLRALEEIKAAAATGRLMALTRNGRAARLYAFKGELYAVELDGYEPPIAQRLMSGDRVARVHEEAFRALEPDASPAQRARTAASREWVAVEDLGSIHQEHVLAAFGAVLCADVVSTSFSPGSATSEVCALPAAIDVLSEAAALRDRRMRDEWAGMSEVGDPQDAVMLAAQEQLPDDCRLPEFLALLQALDGHRTLEQAAFECGYTLAEAVHLASALFVRRLVTLTALAAPKADALLVPEGFARTSAPTGEARSDALTIAEADSVARTDELADVVGTADPDADLEHHARVVQVQALLEELARAEAQVASIRAELELMGPVLADA